MNSLQDLNNFGAVPLDYLDARPSGVRFNREYPLLPLNQEITITSTTVLPSPGIEIEEIINYQTANVRYRVSIQTGTATPLTGSTISWASLPSGATLSQVGDVYTISGIHSPADWDAVKNFTWTLPVTYASYPLWYLLVEIVYYDSLLAEEISVEWLVYDDRFYWVAQLQSTATVTTIGGVKSPATASISATTTVSCNPFNILIGTGTLSSTTTVSVEGSVNVDYLMASSTVSVAGNLGAVGASALSATTTANFSGYVAAVNLTDRTYLANTNNRIFETNTPTVDTGNPATDIVTVVLTSALGKFASSSTAAPVTTLTISGIKAAVNAALLNVYFYPTKGSSASGTFSWQQSLNATVLFTKTIGLTGFANNFAESTTVAFTSAGQTFWTPTSNQSYYGLADILLVGGGGGGGCGTSSPTNRGGGGGGGGGVRTVSNIPLAFTQYLVEVGDGGLGYTNAAGQNGGNSNFSDYPTTTFTHTANGGTGGGIGTNTGGASGAPTSFSGGTGLGFVGGGGGGASEAGNTDGQGQGGDALSVSGIAVYAYYGAGGGAGNTGDTTVYVGGFDAAGNGDGASTNKAADNGTNGTYTLSISLGGGGGGGGSVTPYKAGAKGGRGIVIIKIHA